MLKVLCPNTRGKIMIIEFIRSFILVFAAELGDKSQLIAMTFATQYKIKDVLFGVVLGVVVNHGLAITLGNVLSKIIPMNLIQIMAGFLFIIFGLNALKSSEDEEIEDKKCFSPIATVALAFFIGELGDKTQLTAMTLSAEAQFPLIILIGTTLGMVSTSGFGIFIGSKVGDKIPELFIMIASSLLFIVFGVSKVITTLPDTYLTPINITFFIVSIFFIELFLIRNLILKNRARKSLSPLKELADKLYGQTQILKETLDSICLGESICGTCTGVGCLLGYIRFILKDARENTNYYDSFSVDMNKLIRKNYDKDKVLEALMLVVSDFEEFGWEFKEDFVLVKVKDALEMVLFGSSVQRTDTIEKYVENIDKIDSKIGVSFKQRFI